MKTCDINPPPPAPPTFGAKLNQYKKAYRYSSNLLGIPPYLYACRVPDTSIRRIYPQSAFLSFQASNNKSSTCVKMGGGEEKGEKPARFNSLLDRWKQADDKTGATPFEVTAPKKNKSKIAKQNEDAIREYKKTFKTKNFKAKTPTRGMSVYNKPAQLQNVFGAKVEDLSEYKPPVFEKSDEAVKIVREGLGKNFFFDDMSPADLSAFVNAFEPCEVAKGTPIFKQGKKADYFYVIEEGRVSFFVDGEKVKESEKGGSFGEIALLYKCPRAATVIAESEPTRLFRVDQKTFRSLLQKQRKVLQKKKMQLLESVDFLKEIDAIDMKRLGSAMTPKDFEPGDCLVKKGDEGDAFYIIKEGEVKVTDISVGSTTFDDVVLKEGDYFGERALATKEPRAANVTATTKGTAFCIDQKTFEKVLGKFSRVIMKAQDRRVMDGIEILALANISAEQTRELSHLVTDKKFKAGATIFDSLKSHEAALYILREGTVQLSGKRTDEIKPGGYFGEEMLLLDVRQESVPEKRAQTKTNPEYTAKAVDECFCGVLTLSDCRTVFDTTNMIDIVQGVQDVVLEENDEENSDDDMAAVLAPVSTLNRETTKQWLAKSSKEVLRTVVKTTQKLEDFEKHSILGEGQFGEVWLVSADLPGDFGTQLFALKAQKKDDPTRGDSIVAIKREIDVLGLMDHPYIVNLVHHYEDPEHVYILMALVHGGELFDVIHTEQEDGTWTSGLPESDAKFYAMVIADTLDYIHRKQYVFRDLKPENVLIDKDGYPIICDFGFAKYVADKTYTLCGTPNYLSPEVIMNRGHNASSDHWALGVVIYEMVAGESPFFYDGMPQMELFQLIVKEKFYPLPDDVSDEAFYVIEELLEKDPTQRLGSLAGRGKDILAKEWFADLDLGEVRQKKFPAPFIPKNAELDDMVEQAAMGSSLRVDSMQAVNPPGLTLDGSVAPLQVGFIGTSNKSSLLDDSDEDD